MCMNALNACMYMYYMCDLYLWTSEEGNGFSGAGVTDGSKPLDWELNLGAL